jgi:hypothetical protein
VAEGERNNTLFKSSAALASLGLREGEILRLLKAPADAIGLRGSEFFTTVKSGVKSGYANPRVVPDGTTERKPAIVTKPRVVVAGDEGPPRRDDEVRRHVYRRTGVPVRIKIKRSVGPEVLAGGQAGRLRGLPLCRSRRSVRSRVGR